MANVQRKLEYDYNFITLFTDVYVHIERLRIIYTVTYNVRCRDIVQHLVPKQGV